MEYAEATLPAGSARRGRLTGSRKIRLSRWVAAGLLVSLALWAAWRFRDFGGFDVRYFFATFTHTRWGWLSAAIVVGFATYFGRAVRWAVILEPQRPRASLRKLFSSTVIGFTAILLLGRPGELVRPYLISVNEGVTFSSQLAAWLLERIYDTLLILGLFGCALALFSVGDRDRSETLGWVLRTGGWVATGITAVCLAALFALHRWSSNLRERLSPLLTMLAEHHQDRAERFLDSLIEGFSSARSITSVARLFGWSMATWAAVTAGFACLLRAFPETSALDLSDVIVFMGFVAFGSIVQIPGIGGGTQVVATVCLVEIFRVPLEAATGIAVALWLASLASTVPAGIYLTLREGIHWQNLRHLKDKVEA